MIIVAGTIDLADPASREDAISGSLQFQEATRREEPGCLAYCFAADPLVEGRIQVYELWQDEAALAAHFEHPNYLNMRTYLMGQGLKGADNRKYRVDKVAPVYDDTRTPRADFDHVVANQSGN